MADLRKSVAQNVPGDFFVDSTCIDCDTCRQLAGSVFGEAADTAYVKTQPQTSAERREALHALVCCPTGSIGTLGNDDPKSVYGDFPMEIESPVYYCGFNSPKSFGGNSYLVCHPQGNWLIDSPKYLPQLTRRMEALGGVSRIFLTHADDVADAEKYARHFSAERMIHRAELHAQRDAEMVLDGTAPRTLADGFLAIPTPGHTAGHCVLLVRERFLFTGDHLWYERHTDTLGASRAYCWHSWSEQIESLRLLTHYRFDWILPGHGQRVYFPAGVMQDKLETLVESL